MRSDATGLKYELDALANKDFRYLKARPISEEAQGPGLLD